MKSVFISLLFSLGAATWIYLQLERRMGVGNTKQAAGGAVVAFVLVFLFFFVTLKYVLNFE